MKLVGNIIWHIPFCGFISATLTYLLGLLLTLTVVAAPIGLGLMELGKLLFWPFGSAMVKQSDLTVVPNTTWQTYSKVVTVIYLPFGLIFVVIGTIQVVMLFLSIVGIPAAMVVAKSLGTYLNPVGKKKVSSAIADELERREAQRQIDSLPPVHSHSKSPIAETQTVQSVASKETKDSTQGLTKKPNFVGYAAVAVGVLVLMPVVFSLFSGDKNQKTSSYGVSTETTKPAFDGGAARLAEEKAAKEKEFAEQLAAEKLASEKAKAEADAKAASEKLAAERLAADKLASEKAKADADAKAAAKPTAPVATIAQPTPTAKNPNAAIVDSMVKDGMDCFKAKRYDCAISQAKSALRLDPNSASAKSLQQKAKAAQQAAMDSIEIR